MGMYGIRLCNRGFFFTIHEPLKVPDHGLIFLQLWFNCKLKMHRGIALWEKKYIHTWNKGGMVR